MALTPPLFIALALSLLVGLAGLLVWALLLLFGVRGHAWRVLKWSLVSYLLAVPAVLFLIGPLAASALLAAASTRPQDRALTETPGSYGRSFSAVSFPSRDGLELRGWWMEGSRKRPPIVLCHGLFRDRREVLDRGCRLNERGFPVLLFDFRQHGESDPARISLGYNERLDVLGAVDWLRQQVSSQAPVLMGVSMGAVACLLAAAEMKEPAAAVVADSPFQSLDSTVRRHTRLLLSLPAFPFADLFLWNFARINHFDPSRLSVQTALRSMPPTPILLIYGREDRRMPPETAQRIFQAIPWKAKELVFFDGASHGASYRIHPEAYLESVESFLERYQGAGGEARAW